MATIIVETSKEVQEQVLMVIKELEGKTIAVATIARMAGLKESAARYAIMDLIDAGLVEKVPTRAFNAHYVRYSYKIVSC